MFLASTAMYSGGIRYLINSRLPCEECRGLPGSNSLFFCFAKSKVSKRKGDPQSGPLCGSLKYRQETENLETCLLCSLRTSKFFNPSPADISSPARTGWEKNAGADSDFLPLPHPVLAGLRSAGGSGSKFLDVRRRQSRLVSKNSAAFEHRKLPEAKRRDPDCGSPFFCLLFFGEAKKSELPPGNPGTPRKVQQLKQSAI